MASKADLESKAAQLKTVPELVSLAYEALEEPKDIEYATELVAKAENLCQLPGDYAMVAEIYSLGLNNKDSAEEMLEEAEGACFEAMEYAIVGHVYAKALGNKEKAMELLESAADSAKKLPEFLAISQYVLEDTGNPDLAKQLMDKVEAQCKSFDDYANLAKSLIQDQNNKDSAKILLKKSENKISDISETYKYVSVIKELFDDKDWITEALENVVDDAQFTKDYIILARAYKGLCGDEDKASEMITQAKDFAMTGEENILLANAALELYGDKDTAKESFDKALKDLNDKNQLLEIAAKIARELGDKELAKKYYSRAETKISGVKDIAMLAKAVVSDLGDKDYASEIYKKAESGLTDVRDILTLASEYFQATGIEDYTLQLLRKAFGSIDKFVLVGELLQTVKVTVNDKAFIKEILDLGVTLASGTTELINIANLFISELDLKDMAAGIGLKAEESVTNLAEMKEIKAFVSISFSEDTDWLTRVSEKLRKREENQSVYDDFQKRENNAKTLKELLSLLDDMMASLNDFYYARKILQSAEALLDSEKFSFAKYRKLILAIQNYLGDNKWIESLLDRLINSRVVFYFDLCAICECALLDLTDKALGEKLASEYLQSAEGRIALIDKPSVYQFTDIALTAFKKLNSKNWSIQLLEKAAQYANDPYSYIHLSYLAGKFGDEEDAASYLNHALEGTKSLDEAYSIILAMRLKSVSNVIIRNYYFKYLDALKSKEDKLAWAETAREAFNDNEIIKDAFEKIKGDFKAGSGGIWYSSRKRALELEIA